MSSASGQDLTAGESMKANTSSAGDTENDQRSLSTLPEVRPSPNDLSREWVEAGPVDLYSHDAAYNELFEDGRVRIIQDEHQILTQVGYWVAIDPGELHQALRQQSAQSKLMVRVMSGQSIVLPKIIRKAVCNLCLDRTTVLKLACPHFICASCTRQAFDLASRDEPSFPPRCCQRIPISIALVFLDDELHHRYTKKTVEFSTKERVYCSVAECSEFIPRVQASLSGRADAQCPRCGSWTCVKCRGKGHAPTPCPADLDSPEDQILAKTAAKQGWQQCRSCKRFVERVDGCNHILCVCGHDFCYKCGGDDETCDCDSEEGDLEEDDLEQGDLEESDLEEGDLVPLDHTD